MERTATQASRHINGSSHRRATMAAFKYDTQDQPLLIQIALAAVAVCTDTYLFRRVPRPTSPPLFPCQPSRVIPAFALVSLQCPAVSIAVVPAIYHHHGRLPHEHALHQLSSSARHPSSGVAAWRVRSCSPGSSTALAQPTMVWSFATSMFPGAPHSSSTESTNTCC